ncbi:hypothetical protein IJ843_04420 [bacterium]|nr:hypothetical protein [bacterium]
MSTNKTLLTIDDKARSYARIYSSLIPDQFQRKRANAAIMALFAYVELLKKSEGISVQNSMTMYRTPFLCEQFEIADFYVNNYHIDVRVTTEENTVLIPKIHYDDDIVPDFYAAVKMDLSLKTAEFLGIIDTSDTRPEPFDYHYYKIPSSDLISNEEFLERIKQNKELVFDEKQHDNFNEKYLCFVDNEIGNQGKIEILRHLFNCPDCRTDFCCFTGFEMVSCNAAKYPEILEDKTLDIVGAQSVEDEKYRGKEEQVYIGKGEAPVQPQNTVSETPKSTNNENKDEVSQKETYESKPSETSYKPSSSSGYSASSMMSDEDFQHDETKMDFVPDVVSAPENKDNNMDSSAIVEENSDDFFDELFSSDENKMSEISEIQEENDSIFENVPEGVSVKPDDLQLIPDDDDDEYTSGNDEMTIIEKVTTPEEDNQNTQKVIIDYDEAGKPIYSYITSADGTGPASEIQNLEDKNGNQNESGELDFDLDDLIDETDKKEEEENKTEEQITEEITETQQAENSVDDLDILDQMFVDGALEREAREQQEVSYTPLGTPVDSHIANESEGPDTLPEPSEKINSVEKNEEEKDEKEDEITEESSSNDNVDIEDAKEGELEENEISSSENNEIRMLDISDISEENSASSISKEDEIKQLTEEDIENEKSDAKNDEILDNFELESDEEKASENNKEENVSVTFLKEDSSENDENEDNKILTEAETNEEQEIEKSDSEEENEEDELLNVLPSDSKNTSVPIFDGYIESELSKKNDEETKDTEDDETDEEDSDDEDEEYDEEDDEEYEDDDEDDEDDDDEEGEEDMSDGKQSSLKKVLLIIVIIAVLLVILGAGAFFFMKSKNLLSIGTFEGEKEITAGKITVPQSGDLFEIEGNETNADESVSLANSQDGTVKKITLGDIKNKVNQVKSAVSGETIVEAVPVKKLTESDLTKSTSHGDINKAITNALSNGKNLITLRGVNWKCEAELFSDRAFKKYLQGLDNTLKQNLKNNIMMVTEVPPKNQVVTKFAVDNNRNLRKVVITESSGSDEVDEIVLRSINETFEGEKSPILSDSPLKAAMYFFEVVIKL